MLSYIFVFIIVISVITAIFTGQTEQVSSSIMDGAAQSVELMITMCGMMCLWSGVMEVAKQSKLTEKMSALFAPILKPLFPDVDKNSKAFSCICMNVSANLLGLANAATPLGISAMKELKSLADTDKATDSMVTFVVMNTASIQLLPTTLATLRVSYGSNSPFDIIFCVWVTSIIALAAGLIVNRLCCTFGRQKWST